MNAKAPDGFTADVNKRGLQAQRLLDDPLLQEAFETADGILVAQWRGATTPEERELVHAQVNGLLMVKRMLRKIIGDREYALNQ